MIGTEVDRPGVPFRLDDFRAAADLALAVLIPFTRVKALVPVPDRPLPQESVLAVETNGGNRPAFDDTHIAEMRRLLADRAVAQFLPLIWFNERAVQSCETRTRRD